MEIEEGKLSLRLQLDQADLSKLCQNLSAPLVQLPKDPSSSETTFNIGYFVKGSLAIDHVNDIILLNIDLQQCTQTRGVQTEGCPSLTSKPSQSTPKPPLNVSNCLTLVQVPPMSSPSPETVEETPPGPNLSPATPITSEENKEETSCAKPIIKNKTPLNINWGIKTKSGKTSWTDAKPMKRVQPSKTSLPTQKSATFRYRDPYLKVLYRLRKKGIKVPTVDDSSVDQASPGAGPESASTAAAETTTSSVPETTADTALENPVSAKMGTVGVREPRYACNLCGARYRSKVWFDEHKCSKPKEEKTYDCPHCGQVLHTKFSLDSHVRMHEGVDPYVCSVCGQRFKCYSTMRYHERKHIRGKPYECTVCGKTYTHSTNLKNHVKTHTTPTSENPASTPAPGATPTDNGQTFENAVAEACADLGSETTSEEASKVVQDDIGDVSESVNETDFATKEGHQEEEDEEPQFVRCGVNRRKRKVRNKGGRANFECQVCGIAYNSRVWFEEHQCSGKKRPHYQCEECGKLCYTKFSYKAHANMHKGELPYECDTCHEKFDSISRLRYHEKKHGDSFPFKCHLCDKAYTHVSNLKIHLLRHSGTLPYQCEHCGRMFSAASKLKLHINTHTRMNQTECPECKKVFSAREQMLRHIRRVRCPVLKERMRSNATANGAGEAGAAEVVKAGQEGQVTGGVDDVEEDMSGLLPDQIVETVVVICEKGSEVEFSSDSIFLLSQDSDADKA